MERDTVDKNVVAYVGPSLFGVDLNFNLYNDIEFLSPVKRGDIQDLVNKKFKGTIIIIDGYFHSQPAISHSEILSAIKYGCTVWGTSSMGAIRAREMHTLGMRGYGYVFDQFQYFEDFMDDEVALMHSPTFPYKPITEPLVNIRFFLNTLIQSQELDENEANYIIEFFKNKYFGDREISDLFKLLKGLIPPNKISYYEKNFSNFRIKTIDAFNFINERQWTQ